MNALDLGPGDRVLFKRGTRCTGTLAPKGSGSAEAPITHDVNGDDTKDEYGSAGITMWVEGNTVPTLFDDVQISGNSVTSVDRSGIFLFSSWNKSSWGKESPGVHQPWTRVRVNGNTVTDVGGDGIVLGSVAGALAEHNRVHGYQRRSACGAVVRYNLSVNDHFRGVENCAGPIESAAIYNNTFVIGDGVSQNVINENNANPRNVRFANNLVLKQGSGTAAFKLRSGGYKLENNLISGAAVPPEAVGTVTGDPLLTADHRLRAGSPALKAGTAIDGNGGRDYFGNPVTCTTDIGAHQLSTC